ncbi:Cdc6/Cdc18 family protein [Halorussus aquaticus]|uniref:ORC1-type DNA replication protein n=1 Tax=Halorussus aquaticus TaxID=2953748 RepID=A0ABD5Q5Q2_9EURY|nr:AAA family ATPase [Halorussus aquaticus]
MTTSESIFEDEVELIENAEVLEEDYTPDEFVCRDEVLEDYLDVYKPIYKGRPPENAFLYGDTGVGKTAATKYLLNNLERDLTSKNESLPKDEQRELNVIWVNCENFTKTDDTTSSYQIAIGIVNKFREPGDKLSNTGYAPRDVYSMMYEEFDALGGTILVILDEVEKIGSDQTILYDIPRARDSGYLTEARVGVIGISNDYEFRKNLSPKIKDSLCETEVYFPQYTSPELQEIVRTRAEKALSSGAYDTNTIARCGAKAYQNARGSARRAIRLLKKSAEIAEKEGVEPISDDHIDRAHEKLQYDNLVQKFTDQDNQKLYILKAVAHLTEQGKTPARTSTIHGVYEAVAYHYGDKPLTQRGMFNHLSKLVMFGWINTYEHNKGRGTGQWNEHEFSDDVKPDKVQEAFTHLGREWLAVDVTDCE